MELPKYYELYIPFLEAICDGEVHSLKEIKAYVIKNLSISEEEVNEKLSSGKQTIFENRIGWARTYLKKAGLITATQRAHFQITKEGKELLESGVLITDQLLAEKFPAFAAFKSNKKNENTILPNDDNNQSDNETPQETFERVYQNINEQLADDLLTEIMNQSPTFFESLVVDLMKAMGYGEGFVTKASNDGGVDGVIHADKLGFHLIYIQAKRWDTNTTIGRPEIQKFAGAMMGPPKVDKGLFITTAKFTKDAKEYANAQHIILVDGQKLTELMIAYGLGVSIQNTYLIKRIDSDYFADN